MSRHLLNVAADGASSHHPADESSSASWARELPYSEQRGARKNGAEPVHAETTCGTGMPPALAIVVQPVPLPADITGRSRAFSDRRDTAHPSHPSRTAPWTGSADIAHASTGTWRARPERWSVAIMDAREGAPSHALPLTLRLRAGGIKLAGSCRTACPSRRPHPCWAGRSWRQRQPQPGCQAAGRRSIARPRFVRFAGTCRSEAGAARAPPKRGRREMRYLATAAMVAPESRRLPWMARQAMTAPSRQASSSPSRSSKLTAITRSAPRSPLRAAATRALSSTLRFMSVRCVDIQDRMHTSELFPDGQRAAPSTTPVQRLRRRSQEESDCVHLFSALRASKERWTT